MNYYRQHLKDFSNVGEAMRHPVNLFGRVACYWYQLHYDLFMPRKAVRTETIKVRVTPAQKLMIQEIAEHENLSVSEYLAGTAVFDNESYLEKNLIARLKT